MQSCVKATTCRKREIEQFAAGIPIARNESSLVRSVQVSGLHLSRVVPSATGCWLASQNSWRGRHYSDQTLGRQLDDVEGTPSYAQENVACTNLSNGMRLRRLSEAEAAPTRQIIKPMRWMPANNVSCAVNNVLCAVKIHYAQLPALPHLFENHM